MSTPPFEDPVTSLSMQQAKEVAYERFEGYVVRRWTLEWGKWKAEYACRALDGSLFAGTRPYASRFSHGEVTLAVKERDLCNRAMAHCTPSGEVTAWKVVRVEVTVHRRERRS